MNKLFAAAALAASLAASVAAGAAFAGPTPAPPNASATDTTEMMLMMPIAAKTDSMMRAETYPSETVSLCLLTSG